MSTEQEPQHGGDSEQGRHSQQQPQPQPQPGEGHAGHGSDSALKHLRDWEQRRAIQSGGTRRQGPN